MQKEQFKEWLKEKGYKSNIDSLISRVARVDECYNVDNYYQKSASEELIEFLTFTRKDEKNGLEPIASIRIDGDYLTGLASLKSAVKKYYEFLNETNIIEIFDTTISGPIFEGSFEDFNRYVGPKLRNVIQNFTRTERNKEKGICEYCHKPATLQSAHKSGEERPEKILDLLKRYFTVKNKNDWYRVPLDEFEKRFKDAHMPIRKHIFFLCNECHDKYDKRKTITTQQIENERMKKGCTNP